MKQNPSGNPLELDEATCIFGAGILLKHLEALAEEVESVRDARPDIEHIHQARVASRRLRAALPLFTACLPQKKTRGWMKQIREVTRALGEARDTDVQLASVLAFSETVQDKAWKPGVARLVLRLSQKRARSQPGIASAMNHLIASNMIGELRSRLEKLVQRGKEVHMYTPVLYQHSYQAIHAQLEAFLAYNDIVFQPEKITELHEMRIQAKRLRYTVETFSGLYGDQLKPYQLAVRTAQDLLGDIHDCDMWQEFLPRFLEEERARIIEYYGHERPYKRLVPGILALRDDRRQKRAELYQEFSNNWQRWQEEETWDGLQAGIQVPFLQSNALYPPADGAKD